MTIDLKDGVSFDVTEHFREYSVQKTFEEIKKRSYIDPLYDVGFKVFMNDAPFPSPSNLTSAPLPRTDSA